MTLREKERETEGEREFFLFMFEIKHVKFEGHKQQKQQQ